ncbi:division/cell wall cluster transcriptional repressor MraZ [Amnibacterium flavum]|uniref:division/cell wall cluster transcriptional repressor MraZ n=1 Tax=Amnibacterium flavum TaxID=2173173 RepID=UPI001F0B7839|nr:division/cell wall cluster transcriptional repressor MraZ [Amnibacterium flavum]
MLGTYTPKLDEKGRLILPAKFAEDFEHGIVLTRGQDRCLYVYSAAEFDAVHQRMRASATGNNKQTRDFMRLLLSAAHAETPDRQRRVTVPAALRGYAGLERELVVIGAGNHAEIWDAEAWNDYVSSTEDDFATAAGEVIPDLF